MPPNEPVLLTIILPIHYEQDNIAQTLSLLKQNLAIPHEILLIYDDPNDPTIPIVKNIQKTYASIELFKNTFKSGIYGAIQTGLNKSTGTYILFLVADDSGPIVIINSMLKLMSHGYALVSGTRYTKGAGIGGGNYWAKFLSTWGNRIFRLLTGSRLTDLTCGIKMFRKDILKTIPLQFSKDWTIAFELAIQTQCYDFKVAEIPYISYNRVNGGHSHFKILPRIFHYTLTFLWGIRQFWTKRKK